MGCDNVIFEAPEDAVKANFVTRTPGGEWHLYGDTRWPAPSTWVEFPLMNYSAHRSGGIFVLCARIPTDEPNPFEWAAANHPLSQLLPAMRFPATIESIATALRSQNETDEEIAGPDDREPRYVQSYCIYELANAGDEARFVASYTDLLNDAGISIPRFRMGEFQQQDLRLCQFSLHALFRLNAARLAGMKFTEYPQHTEFAPVLVTGNVSPPKWAGFHPSRTLRTRPTLRALPTPKLRNGSPFLEEYQQMIDMRRREANAHLLAFERVARPRSMALMNIDINSSATAFLHRANGGAIYVIPDRLVEEFDHTDCSEVRIADITLPFWSVFLRFDPPHPLRLSDKARVDGCYLVKQEDEYLLTLTSRLDGVDYENSLSVVCVDPVFSLHLPALDTEITISDAVERGIEEFLSKNAPPEEDASTSIERPDGTIAHVIDVRADSRKRRIAEFRSQESAFRACLNIVINAACFISFRPDDIADAWEGQPPEDVIAAANAVPNSRKTRDRKAGALGKIENGDFTRIKICGRDLFSAGEEQVGIGQGNSPRAHWRRGHWRRQKHGPGLSLIVLRWIRPTIVKKDHGTLSEARIYEV